MIEKILDMVIGGLLMGGIYALISMGLSLQYGVARVLNIAHGEFIMLGAFGTWSLHTMLGINPLLSMVISGPLIFLIGFILHRTIFKRLNDLSPSPAVFEGNSMLVSFGFFFIIQNIAKIIWGSAQEGYLYLAVPVNICGRVFPANRVVTLLFAVAICMIFYIFLSRTRLGKAIRAAAQDQTAAGLMGVNINQMLAVCFGLGALMAALAGALISMTIQIQTTMGLEYTVIAIIVVVLGGLGSIPGSLIGGFILGLIGSIVSYIEPALSLVAYYFLFMLLLLVKPTGILGR